MRTNKLIGIAVFTVIASTSLAAEKLYDSVTFWGYGAFQAGQLVRGYYSPNGAQTDFSPSTVAAHQWDESVRSRLGGTFYKGPDLKINLGIEYDYDFFTINPTSTGANQQSIMPLTYYGDLLIHRADLEYGFLTSKDFALKLQLGYFPFKYNPQAANLGEYLFRSECYPNFIVNEFYFAQTRLLGANLEGSSEGTIGGLGIPYHLRQNLLLTSETTYPTQDFSLSYLANADFFNDAFELGGGIDAARILPVNPQRTTPHNADNIGAIDSAIGDTSYYTFTGTKVMARTCFDIKKVAPMNFLGREDLKIYGEWAILGLKDYPVYYDNISQRMPVMFGFDIPAFKLLDVLAFEGEYCTSPYFNDNYLQLYAKDIDPPAIPYILDQQYDQYHGFVTTTAHRWKWSVFARKSFGSNFQIIAQAARDHSRFQNPLNNEPYYLYCGDVTIAGNDWYYLVRLQWNI